VTGRLTYKGEPVPSTTVKFCPDEEGKRPSQGVTDDQGNFTLTNSMTEKRRPVRGQAHPSFSSTT